MDLQTQIDQLSAEVKTFIANTQKDVKTFIDNNLASIKALRGKQLLHFILLGLAFAAIVAGFFMVKSSFKKYTPDMTEINKLKDDRTRIEADRRRFQDSINLVLYQFQARDSLLAADNQKLQTSLIIINRKLKILDDEYKKIPDFSGYSSEQLRRFFANLH